MKPAHGGRLSAACRRYGGSLEQWIDLSTGIAPWTYPLPTVPESVWQRLPETDDDLIVTAAAYYGVATDECIAVAGSQWAIEMIPRLYVKPLKVLMLAHGYSEHPHAWQQAGHHLLLVDSIEALITEAHQCDACVIIQPHNPLGIILSEAQLRHLKNQLRQGILVIDEAFADSRPTPTLPIEPHSWKLRSIGKFFGLAGIRLGFVLAASDQIDQLEQTQSPWSVSHLARWAGKQALEDLSWHKTQATQLRLQSERLQQLLISYQLNASHKTDYFVTVFVENSQTLFESAAQSKLLLRHFPAIHGIRFGLPANQQEWDRLTAWLSQEKGL